MIKVNKKSKIAILVLIMSGGAARPAYGVLSFFSGAQERVYQWIVEQNKTTAEYAIAAAVLGVGYYIWQKRGSAPVLNSMDCSSRVPGYADRVDFFNALELGRVDKVKELLKRLDASVRAAFVNSICDFSESRYKGKGITPLMVTAELGHEEILDILLEYGADPNVKDDEGCTALMYTIKTISYRSKRNIIKKLLAFEADINIKDKSGLTVGEVCLCEEDDELELLLESGVHINSYDSWRAFMVNSNIQRSRLASLSDIKELGQLTYPALRKLNSRLIQERYAYYNASIDVFRDNFGKLRTQWFMGDFNALLQKIITNQSFIDTLFSKIGMLGEIFDLIKKEEFISNVKEVSEEV